jgi:hypothetical protein
MNEFWQRWHETSPSVVRPRPAYIWTTTVTLCVVSVTWESYSFGSVMVRVIMPRERNIHQGWVKRFRDTLVQMPSNDTVNCLIKGETKSCWNEIHSSKLIGWTQKRKEHFSSRKKIVMKCRTILSPLSNWREFCWIPEFNAHLNSPSKLMSKFEICTFLLQITEEHIDSQSEYEPKWFYLCLVFAAVRVSYNKV